VRLDHAYDVPKSLYPFAAANLWNLVLTGEHFFSLLQECDR
jgi:hypothetical protein